MVIGVIGENHNYYKIPFCNGKFRNFKHTITIKKRQYYDRLFKKGKILVAILDFLDKFLKLN